MLKGALKTSLFPPPLLRVGTPSTQGPILFGLDHSQNGAPTHSLGKFPVCLTILTLKDFFLTSNLNLPSVSLKPLSLVLSLNVLTKSLSVALLQASVGTGRLIYDLLQPAGLHSPSPCLWLL